MTPKVDVYSGGFPCQPFSAEGKGEGMQDTQGRGLVVKSMLEYISIHRPPVVFLENVTALLRSKHIGLAMYIFIKLRKAVYNVGIGKMITKDHGLPQSRPRVYMVALHETQQKETFHFPKKTEAANHFGANHGQHGLSPRADL